jgi:hypothetical protein
MAKDRICGRKAQRLVEDDGAMAFRLLLCDLAAAAAEPTEEVDLRELLGRGTDPA